MRSKIASPQFSILAYDFIVRPISVLTTAFPQAAYALELQKGPQHVITFAQVLLLGKSKEFLFSHAQQVSVKLHNPKYATFAWSLYRDNDQSMEFLDSAKFNLNDHYERYSQEIRSNLDEYLSILGDKSNGRQIGNRWKSLKSHLKNSQSIGEATNECGSFKVRFSLQIRGELDDIADQQVTKCKIASRASFESDAKSNSSKKSLNGMRINSNKDKEVCTIAQVKGDLIMNKEVNKEVVKSHMNSQNQQSSPQHISSISDQLPAFIQKNTKLRGIVLKSKAESLHIAGDGYSQIRILQGQSTGTILEEQHQTSYLENKGTPNQQHTYNEKHEIQGRLYHIQQQQQQQQIKNLKQKPHNYSQDQFNHNLTQHVATVFTKVEGTVSVDMEKMTNQLRQSAEVKRSMINIKTLALFIPILLAVLSCLMLFKYHSTAIFQKKSDKSKGMFSKGKGKGRIETKNRTKL